MGVDNDGRTPLCWALRNGNCDVAELLLLLDHGALLERVTLDEKGDESLSVFEVDCNYTSSRSCCY